MCKILWHYGKNHMAQKWGHSFWTV